MYQAEHRRRVHRPRELRRFVLPADLEKVVGALDVRTHFIKGIQVLVGFQRVRVAYQALLFRRAVILRISYPAYYFVEFPEQHGPQRRMHEQRVHTQYPRNSRLAG